MQDETIVREQNLSNQRERTIVISVTMIQAWVELWTKSPIELGAYAKYSAEVCDREQEKNKRKQEDNYLGASLVEL